MNQDLVSDYGLVEVKAHLTTLACVPLARHRRVFVSKHDIVAQKYILTNINISVRIYVLL